jgi:succinyl-diaminopimelate desuccinylase
MNIETARTRARASIAQLAGEKKRDVVDIALNLLSRSSANPPGDTRAMAAEIVALLNAPDIEVAVYPTADHIHNVVACVRGSGPGPRIILNGHLDTFPLGDRSKWSVPPTGVERDGRLYGLGISDMKGGVAASIFALRHLAASRTAWRGEVVATFAGDEETMGVLGTQYLLDHVPEARGDAVICADAGSLKVLRIGEKGFVWLRISAKGVSCHAAHVHRGVSAIDKLLTALNRIAELRQFPVPEKLDVKSVIERAKPVSEPMSGAGESDVLRKITVTFGTIQGGQLPNLVADKAEATADIRLPLGFSADEARRAIAGKLACLEGVEVEYLRGYDPSWTDPRHRIVKVLTSCCEEVIGVEPVINMRVGASDSRLYRKAGIPTVVCGLTPNNMGAADEYVEVEELTALGVIITLAAFDFLNSGEDGI